MPVRPPLHTLVKITPIELRKVRAVLDQVCCHVGLPRLGLEMKSGEKRVRGAFSQDLASYSAREHKITFQPLFWRKLVALLSPSPKPRKALDLLMVPEGINTFNHELFHVFSTALMQVGFSLKRKNPTGLPEEQQQAIDKAHALHRAYMQNPFRTLSPKLAIPPSIPKGYALRDISFFIFGQKGLPLPTKRSAELLEPVPQEGSVEYKEQVEQWENVLCGMIAFNRNQLATKSSKASARAITQKKEIGKSLVRKFQRALLRRFSAKVVLTDVKSDQRVIYNYSEEEVRARLTGLQATRNTVGKDPYFDQEMRLEEGILAIHNNLRQFMTTNSPKHKAQLAGQVARRWQRYCRLVEKVECPHYISPDIQQRMEEHLKSMGIPIKP